MIPETSHIDMLPGGKPVRLDDIPVLGYADFAGWITGKMASESVHCVLYYAFPYRNGLKFIAVLADDRSGKFLVSSHQTGSPLAILESLTPQVSQLHLFEREIHENFGTGFTGHPWLKPVRFPHNRYNTRLNPDNYPFYRIDSGELHEVGVGPIHAGVIEPGHFRFICNGERVLHLEIVLGYQHRGIEKLMREAGTQIRRSTLAESIAGDSAVAHSDAHSRLMESLTGFEPGSALQTDRAIGLELERIAVHIGDTAALCTDVAYQFGQVVNEALRTIIINTTQLWSGNRFGKGLIRPGGTRYPLTPAILESMLMALYDAGSRYHDITENIFTSPSVLIRFDGIGTVTRQQALSIGAVGMAARMAGVGRDIRASHPVGTYAGLNFQPEVLDSGDVLARARLRSVEAQRSIGMVRELAEGLLGEKTLDIRQKTLESRKAQGGRFGVAVTEGWRGEIAHAAVTDSAGEILHYKIKDPSFHNWMALALAVRNQEISDFPVCNKSFNLSYCGHDL